MDSFEDDLLRTVMKLRNIFGTNANALSGRYVASLILENRHELDQLRVILNVSPAMRVVIRRVGR